MLQVNEIEGAEVRDVEDIGTLTVRLPAPVVKAALQYAEQLDLLGDRVKAIKFLRWQFKVGLKEAHRLVLSMARDRSRAGEISCKACGWEGADEDQARCPACGAEYSYPEGVFA